MRRLRIYLDTSVISHLFHDDTPERQAATQELFENAIAPELHDTFISTVVLGELEKTPSETLRSQFAAVLGRYPISLLPPRNSEVESLAGIYISKGILPSKKPQDALHVAYATVYGLDVLVTWNFRHLARPRTTSLIASVNLAEGFSSSPVILTPLEVLNP